MSARDELIEIVSRDPQSSGGDSVWATDLVDALVAEARNEDAAILRERAGHYPTRRIFAAGLRHGALLLAKAAMGKNPAPGDTAPFFQPGHTYTRPHHGQPITFFVSAVSTSPDGHTTVAHGWRITPYTNGGWEITDADDMDGWTDITDGGEDQ
jgi:hypothetical protein